MTKEAKFERKTWAPTDTHPNSAELNRIEGGIELAHERVDQLTKTVADSTQTGGASESIDLATAKYREIEYLSDNAKVADLVVTVNKLLAVLRKEENQGDGAD